MKLLVGYSVWNKTDMLSWLLEGVAANFNPEHTEVAFHFDACSDGSDVAFDSLVPYWLLKRGNFKPEQVHKLTSAQEVREVGGHNRLIQLGLDRGCDAVIVAQDDQRFNQEIHSHIEALHVALGTKLGVVTGRDAYHEHYTSFTGSFWTESPVGTRLPHGGWAARPYMNSGPVVYNRNLVEKIGMLDENFRAHYVWDDYGARAHKAGFTNGVLGMDVTHAKFGRMTATTWLDSGADLARLRAKHGGDII